MSHFKPEERHVFTYWDGARERAGDPLEIQERLLEYPELDLETDIKLAGTSVPTAGAARRRIIGAVRTAFGVEPYARGEDGSERGLLGAECVELLDAFASYLGELKKKAGF